MVPPWLVTQILIGVAKFLPTQKLVPTQDLGELAVRDAKKKELVRISLFSVANQLQKVIGFRSSGKLWLQDIRV